MDIRQKINRMRIERGWSLAQLAHKICISETSVYNWYNENDYMPTVRVLEDVCQVFGITMSELFADADVDKLTANQIRMLDLFDKLNEKKQQAILTLTESYLD